MDKNLLNQVMKLLGNCEELLTPIASELDAERYSEYGESYGGDCHTVMVRCRKMIEVLEQINTKEEAQ